MLAAATGVLAQIAGQGSITGTVVDPTGAVVPNATVVVHDTDTGADRAVNTNADGIYTATFLQSGIMR